MLSKTTMFFSGPVESTSHNMRQLITPTNADLETPVKLCRREFLATTALAATTIGTDKALADDGRDSQVAFFLVGDTHYLANKDAPSELDERSRRVTNGLIDTLNALPNSAIPAEAGGGKVARPRGVIHAGDLIDSGDKNGRILELMQATEWNAYAADFGIDGQSGRLTYPTYEVHGNHDGPQGKGIAINGIAARNKQRQELTGLSHNNLHCSWDWGPVHFVNLGIVVGQVPEVTQRRRYDPGGSLEFLIADLREHVGDSRKPVVLTHHIDVARYAVPCAADDPKNLSREWHPCDVHAYYEAIRSYNVIAILYGHTHARNIFRWNGSSARATDGVPVFNVDNSAHFHSENQAFLYFEINRTEMVIRECATRDAWQSHFWTPQIWKQSIRLG